jgi:hypothetical protein
MVRTETALWAVPAEPDRERLAAAIAAFAERLGSPPFEPHATVFGSLTLPRDRVAGIASRAAGETAPFSLAPGRIGHSAELFQCLYLELASPEPILALRRLMAAEVGKSPGAAAVPHVSLAYAALPGAEREALGREVSAGPLAALPIRFEALALVAPRHDEPPDWRDVAGWRVLGRIPLVG